jgi:hypothetical protein
MTRKTRTTTATALALVALSGLPACAKKAQSPTPSPAAATGKGNLDSPAVSARHAYMTEHYAHALAMQRAVIAGELDEFERAATFIAEHDVALGSPETWKPHLRTMQRAAAESVGVESLEAAAVALASLGSSCANCHRELGSPQLTLGKPPGESADVARHMRRHQWAADRMWDGLIVPSRSHWIEGAEAMAMARLTSDQIAPATPDVDAIARRVHYQANKARLLEERDWASAYADLLVTCSSCHRKTGVGSGAD